MFDYFRYIAEELNGIDAEKAEKLRKEREEKERADTYIFSKRAKRLFVILGVFFFVVSIFTLMYYSEHGSENVINIIISIIQGCVSAEVALCMIIKKKKAEIYGVAGIGVFVLMLLIAVIT